MRRSHLPLRPRPALRNRENERGVVLAVVLVFLVVLALTAALSTALTRTNIQVVNHLQNSKEALQIAEAGVAEALYRLSITDDGALVDPNGVEFNASIAPKAAHEFKLDPDNLDSKVQILFISGEPSKSGDNVTAPTLQRLDAASRLPYSTETADFFSNTPVNLTIEWEKSGGAILMLPLGAAQARPVVRITATGQSGAARRTVVVRAMDIPADPCEGPNLVTSDSAACPGLEMGGNATITVENGSVHVNGGTSPTDCPEALDVGGRASIDADAINVVGGASEGRTDTYDPPPATGVTPADDPYGYLLPPCFNGYSGTCLPLESDPQPHNSTLLGVPICPPSSPEAPERCTVAAGTLNPGIYYGGLEITGPVTLNAGLYIMAGGGFTLATGNTHVAGGGITIFNTLNPASPEPDYGSIFIGNGNAGSTPSASTDGPYEGILLFQDRDNTETIQLQGGTTSDYLIDGAVYAPNAPVELIGNTQFAVGGSMIVATLDMTGGSDLTLLDDGSCEPPPNEPYTPIAWQDF